MNDIMRSYRRCHAICIVAAAILICGADVDDAWAQRFATGQYKTPAGRSPTAELIRNIGIDQHLDTVLPLDAEFTDEAGTSVHLKDYFTDKPVVIALVQYRCPMLCTQVLNGVLKSSQAMPLEIGRDFHVVAISFDAREQPEAASQKKTHYVRAYRRGGGVDGWHFLTGSQQLIDQVTDAVGFRYRYESRTDQFAHPSGIVVVTPQGRISKYFYGIDYAPSDLRLGLVESSSGGIGTIADQVLLLCYHYDPLTGKYGLVISTSLRIAGVLTVLVLVGYLIAMSRREWKMPRLVRGGDANGSDVSRNDAAIVHVQAADQS